MSKPDLSTRTQHEYKGAVINILHRPDTNDHIYIVKYPMQLSGLAGTAAAALKRAKQDIDILESAKK